MLKHEVLRLDIALKMQTINKSFSGVEETVMEHRSMRSHSYIANEDDATWILTSAFIIFTMQSGNFFSCFD